MRVSDVKERAQGQWVWILSSMGIDQGCLNNNHGPCPGCGGEDRFRFDDRGGNGGWFCGGGGQWEHGDGFDLLCHVLGWDMKQAVDEVGKFLDMDKERPVTYPPRPAPAPAVRAKSKTRRYAYELWKGSRKDACEHPYAMAKGIWTNGPLDRAVATGRRIGERQDCLVVPATNISTGEFQGVQVMTHDGRKQSFGDIKGATCLLGNTLSKKVPWFVVEGYADAYSIVFHIYDGHAAAAVAFGSGMLDGVAEAIAEKYQPDEITIIDDAE